MDRIFISDEEGYVYEPSDELVKITAGKYNDLNSKEAIDYIGDALDKWKALPLLIKSDNTFRKIGHVLTIRK